MEEKISTRIVIIILFVLLIAAFLLVPITANSTNDYADEAKPSSQSAKILVFRLDNGVVSLYDNDKAIKSYDIDISLLPGEDVKLLYEGIVVKSEAEADMLAEDFDG